jgi:tRNA(Ile)-lysidine synthase
MDVVERVRQTIQRYEMLPPGSVVVGVSGGADSVALLHVLLRLRDELGLMLYAAHLNHGIRGSEADADAAFVEALARDWGVPCVVETADVPALARERKLAIEEAARQARYAFLLRVARQIGADAVAVAHHADDQAETVLMHFLRGAGLAGMRGILPMSDLTRLRIGASSDVEGGPVRLVRPLLEVSKDDILAYCRDNGLEFRFDRSNLDQTHFRNRLRHELLPLLKTYNPNIREVLRRSAVVAADDYALLLQQLRRAWDSTLTSEGDGWMEFDLRRWRRLPKSLQRGILREAIRRLRHGLRNINWIHVENALDVLNGSDTGAATLPQGLMATARYGRFYVAEAEWSPPPDVPQLAGQSVPVPVPGSVVLPDGRWTVEAEVLDSPPDTFSNDDPWQAWLDMAVAGTDLALRPRHPGEAFAPLGMGGRTQRVNECMINAKVPREWRANWPLLCNPRQVLWVAGLRLDERAAVTPATERVIWIKMSPL